MKSYNKFKCSLSRVFHGVFGLLWVAVLPGIIFTCCVLDSEVLIPVILAVTAFVFHDFIIVIFKKVKSWIINLTVNHSIYVIAAVLMVIQMIIQVYVGYEMAITPAGDRNIIFKQAGEMALSGEFRTSDKYNFYFLRYPNNQLLLILETVWFMFLKFMGESSFLYGNMILNILAIDMSIIFCMIIVYKKYGKNISVLFQILTMLFIPFYTYIPFVYTDTLVLPVVSGLLLLYEVLEENWKKKRLGTYFIIVGIGILTWLGFELKPTVAIITIACCVHMIFAKNIRRGIIYSAALLLIFGTCLKTYNMVLDKIDLVDQTDYDTENFPYAHWIMMGLQGTGNYSLKDREYTSSFKTKEDKEKGDIAMIKKRLKNYGISGLLLHQYIKAVSTWSNGKYDMEYHLQRQPKRESWLQSVFFKDGILYPLYSSYCTLYQWMLLISVTISIILGFIKREMDSAAMWKLALFGLFLFLAVWETKSRYVMQFIPVMFLITVDTFVKGKPLMCSCTKTDSWHGYRSFRMIER